MRKFLKNLHVGTQAGVTIQLLKNFPLDSPIKPANDSWRFQLLILSLTQIHGGV